jgi:putative ABC transport system permease protein
MRLMLKALARKSRVPNLVVMLIIVLAFLLGSVGTILIIKLPELYPQKCEELNAGDITVLSYADNTADIDEQITYLTGVDSLNTAAGEFVASADIEYPVGSVTMMVFFREWDAREHEPDVSIIDEVESSSAGSVYLPYKFKVNYGLSAGDTFTINIADKAHKFLIAGFVEDAVFGAPTNAVAQVYLRDDAEEQLAALRETGSTVACAIYSVFLEDRSFTTDVVSELTSLMEDSRILISSKDLVEQVVAFPNMISGLLVLFSVILLLIAAIVVWFAVNNAILDSLSDIGIWKACGWKNRTIVGAFCTQYGIIAVVGCLVGVVVSALLFPSIGLVIASMAGFFWEIPLDPLLALLVFAAIVLFLLMVAALAGGRLKRVEPIKAIKEKLLGDSHKRSRILPLATSRMNLDFHLALKSVLHNRLRSAMILLISLLITFTTSLILVAYYNLCVEDEVFLEMVGYPRASYLVSYTSEPGDNLVASRNNTNKMYRTVKDLPQTQKLVGFNELFDVDIDGQSVVANVSDDFDALEKSTIIEGSYPSASDEIAISYLIASKIEKSLGDTVEVTIADTTKEFEITGITQQLYNLSNIIDIPFSAYASYSKDYYLNSYMLFSDGLSADDLNNHLEDSFPNSFSKLTIASVEEKIKPLLSSITSAAQTLMLLIVILDALAIALVFILVLSIVIRQETFNYGLCKAFGFTSSQLLYQLSLYSLIPLATGVGIGALVSIFATNAVFSAVLPLVGISKSTFVVPLNYIVIAALALSLFSLLVVLAHRTKIKRLSPCKILAAG